MNRGPVTYERVSLKAVWGGNVAKLAGPIALLALTMFSASCGDLTREGTASSYLVISALEAASGAQPRALRRYAQLRRHHVCRRQPDNFQRPRPRSAPARDEGRRQRRFADVADCQQLHHHHPLSRALHARGRPEHAGRRRAVRVRRGVHRYRRGGRVHRRVRARQAHRQRGVTASGAGLGTARSSSRPSPRSRSTGTTRRAGTCR